MEQSRLSNTKSTMADDIDCLASCIIETYNRDITIRPQARALAGYMLGCKFMSLSECLELFNKNRKKSRDVIDKLLSCESAFMDIEPRSLGIDLVSYTTAEIIQQSLDVKHFQKEKKHKCTGRKIPKIKPNILFNDHEYIWLRWFYKSQAEDDAVTESFFIVEYQRFANILKIKETESVYAYKIIAFDKRTVNATNRAYKFCLTRDVESDVDDFYESENSYTFIKTDEGRFVCTKNRATMDNLNFEKSNDINFLVILYHEVVVFEIASNVYESYVYKTTKRSNSLKQEALLDYYDSKSKCSLIFSSELAFFKYNVLLFISNFIKFMYCYATNQNTFDPKTYNDFKILNIYICEACLFIDSTNLSNMSSKTHGPLIAYTSERPKTLLNKMQNEIFVNEGSRAMQSMNLASDIGVRSNMIEISAMLHSDVYKKNKRDLFFDTTDIL
ncbi:uncharacterized protein LOC112593916 [Melanaphis sacchari]|uniref:uncharacterized protein LOC112593916 n=1 Tax=Melanaphis sacchari TaxID=742174 RepID=UPI000DC1494E|nr:uncharacterized protein LOC112593916 [Melanaphis sacchari]